MNSNNIVLQMLRYNSNLTISSQMRALQIYKYGDINQLTLSNSYQTPAISSPNNVLIKVKATSINPIDIDLINGYGASMFGVAKQLNGTINEFPMTLGRDFSGTVVKVGRHVSGYRPGMNVIGALWPFQEGCQSDYVECCQHQLALMPGNLPYGAAAALPYAGLTAYSSLVEFGGLNASNGRDRRVLIIGAGGGVGTMAVQIGKCLGAHVTVSCRDHSRELLLRLGADAILPGKGEEHIDDKFNLILDCTGANLKRYSKLLQRGSCSRFVTIKHPLLKSTDKYSNFIGLGVASLDFLSTFVQHALDTKGGIYQWGFFRASGRNLGKIAEMAERGLLVPVVHEEFGFESIIEAYRTLMAGSVRGKVVVRVDAAGEGDTGSHRAVVNK